MCQKVITHNFALRLFSIFFMVKEPRSDRFKIYINRVLLIVPALFLRPLCHIISPTDTRIYRPSYPLNDVFISDRCPIVCFALLLPFSNSVQHQQQKRKEANTKFFVLILLIYRNIAVKGWVFFTHC